MSKYLMLAAVFAFLILPWLANFGPEPRELSKVLTFFAFVPLVYLKNLFAKKNFNFTKLDFLFLLFIFLTLLSSCFNHNSLSLTIFGQYYRYQGLVYFLLLWLWSKQLTLINNYLFIFITANILVSFGLLFQYITQHFHLIFYQELLPNTFSLNFGHPNFAAAFVTLSSFCLPTYLLPISFLAILTTQSQTALVALIPHLVAKLSPRSSSLVLISFILILMSLTCFGFQPKNDTFDQRNKLWFYSLLSFSHQPLLGWGIGNIPTALSGVLPSKEFDLHNIRLDNPHNLLLENMLAAGFLGTLIYLTLNLAIYLNLSNSQRPLLLAFWIIGWTNPLNITSYIFWFTLFFQASFNLNHRFSSRNRSG